MNPTLRRLAVAATAVAATSAFAAPAVAATPPQVTVVLPPTTVAAGGNTMVYPLLYAAARVDLQDASMSLELSGSLDGVSLSNSDYDPHACTADGSQKLTCPEGYVTTDQYGLQSVGVKLSATAAALGETGELTVTLTADGISPVTTTVDVTVGEAVDLSSTSKLAHVDAKLGGTFDVALQVHNNSDVVARGAAVIFGSDYAFQSTKKFSNCFYDGDHLNSCIFTGYLAPGTTYGVNVPYQVRADTLAPTTTFSDFDWMTSGDYADLIRYLSDRDLPGPGVAGTGGTLNLTELASAKELPKQTDPNPENNSQAVLVSVAGKQGADLAAVGATFTGTAGQTVPVTVGVRNPGPVTVDLSREIDPAAVAFVTLPPGTTAATVPAGCRSAENGPLPTKAGVSQYLCSSDSLFVVGTSVSWTFQVKVTKASSNAIGSIAVNPVCDCEIFQGDTHKANDVAEIVLNPTSGGQGGGTSGSLPITGPRAATAGGAGILLVAAGVIGFVITRRRRTRFEA